MEPETAAFSITDSRSGTGDRLVRFQQAALDLADVVEDLVRDMETIVLNLVPRTKRDHEIAQVRRARELARLVRAAVADTANFGHLSPVTAPEPPVATNRAPVFKERRRMDRRRAHPVGGPPTGVERRSVETERRHRIRRRQEQP